MELEQEQEQERELEHEREQELEREQEREREQDLELERELEQERERELELELEREWELGPEQESRISDMGELRELAVDDLAGKVEGLRHLLSLAPDGKDVLLKEIERPISFKSTSVGSVDHSSQAMQRCAGYSRV